MYCSSETSRLFHDLDAMVGNTPLLALHFRWRDRQHTIYAKAEFLNLTGSIKDRMALRILYAAYRDGKIAPGDTIAEASSGNSGVAFATLGRALGHPVVIYVPGWMNPERAALIRSFGAHIEPVSRAQGGLVGAIGLCETLALRRGDVFLPCQYFNGAGIEAHRLGTGPELSLQLAHIGRTVNVFAAGVGTGGTIMGVARHLRSQNPKVQVHPLEPAEAPTLSTGVTVTQHRIQGISDEFLPPICDLHSMDTVIAISDGDAILMAQKLAGVLGLGVGISSGANFLGAVRALELHGEHATIATVFCDDNKKYLSTDLQREEAVKPGYLTPRIELLGYEALPRAY
jgi:cysteine synthase